MFQGLKPKPTPQKKSKIYFGGIKITLNLVNLIFKVLIGNTGMLLVFKSVF